MPDDKKSLAEMRKELRELRKESVKPVSRLRKADVSAELERLRNKTETTPLVAATPRTPAKKVKSAVEDIKDAKEAQFPMKPSPETVSVSKKANKAVAKAEDPGHAKGEVKDMKAIRGGKMAKLMRLLDSMEDD